MATQGIEVLKEYDLAMPAAAGKTVIKITIPDEVLEAVSINSIARERLGRTPDGATDAIEMILDLSKKWDEIVNETPAEVAEDVNKEPEVAA